MCMHIYTIYIYIYIHAYIHDSNQTNLNSGRAQKSELNHSDVKKSPHLWAFRAMVQGLQGFRP